MSKFQVAYVPIGVPTFHLESAKLLFDESISLLKSLSEDVVVPDEMLLSIDGLNSFLDTVNPDLIVLQNITFANAQYASEVLARFPQVPIILWTLREPVIDGGRLRLNSLTGAYSAANTIKKYREGSFEYIYGGPSEEKVKSKIENTLKAALVKKKLSQAKIASIGHTPQGFGFGRADDTELLRYFGVRHVAIEARELIDKAKTFSDEECAVYLNDAKERTVGLDNTPENNRLDFARLYKAYKEYVEENEISAIASRCWPDFFTSFGTPVCAVLGILNDLGVASSCEADTYGALSMYIARELSENPVFFGDPVSLNEEENSISFWHCGMAACSLAREDTGAVIGEHCNRHIGPTMEFGLKPAENVTVFRVGLDENRNFRFLIYSGEALDRPKQFFGTSMVVRTRENASEIVNKTVLEGWEPHFVVAYKDIAEELEILGHMLGINVERI